MQSVPAEAAVTTWGQVKASWSDGWRALSERAVATYRSAIEADPRAAAVRAQPFVGALQTSRVTLNRIRARGGSGARYQALEKRYNALAAGFYAEARAVGQPEVGVAPVVIVVGAIAVTVVGVAWAIAATSCAENLREQTAIAERELDARVEASREGRTLQPTTLPTPPTPAVPGGGCSAALPSSPGPSPFPSCSSGEPCPRSPVDSAYRS